MRYLINLARRVLSSHAQEYLCMSAHVQSEAQAQREWVEYLHDHFFSAKTGELRSLGLTQRAEDTFWAASMVRSRTFSDEVQGEGITLMVRCGGWRQRQKGRQEGG